MKLNFSLRKFGLLVLMGLLATPLFADNGQKPTIYISGFINRGQGGDFIGEVVGRSLKSIVEITRQYNVVSPVNISDYLNEAGITGVSPSDLTIEFISENYETLKFDEVLSGSFTPTRDGRNVNIEVKVTRLIDKAETFSKTYRASTDIEIFDTIDEISLELANVLTGKRLGTAEILIATTVDGARIFMDGIEAGKNRVRFQRAIAGLPHIVEIKNAEDEVLFSKEFIVEEGRVYDLNYNYKEFVDFYDESTNVLRMTREEFLKSQRPPVYKKFGFEVVGGRGAFAWVNRYFAYHAFSISFNVSYIPKTPDLVYDNYIPLSLMLTFHALPRDRIFNFAFDYGLIYYPGIKTGPFYQSSIHLYVGMDLMFKPDFAFMPKFIRNTTFFVGGGSFITGEYGFLLSFGARF